MRLNIRKDISVADVAEYVNMSTARFSEKFKKETGLSPADSLSRMRCNKAKQMLSSSRHSITDIAFQLGFSSSQYFASVFKKYTGKTLSEFRKINL
ncbi:MAG: AraC family transcriptional regulator [Verrucomicrobiota bacterium]|nr:AraC family transcriptional regulator [Verrucomicrobiota bacterium]